jgi:ribose transport system permease protein
MLALAEFVSHHTSEEEDEAMTAAARVLRMPLGLIPELPGAAYLFVLLAAGFAFATPEFASPRNLSNIGLQAAALIIVSLGMTLVLLTEGIDLSLGAVLGLAGVVMSLFLVSQGFPLWVALGVALAIGILAGTVNGVFVAWAGMPPFIVTLGTYGMAQSLAMVLTSGNSVTGLPAEVRWFNEGEWLGLPVPIWTVVVTFVVTYLLLYHTRFGRYVFAIGGNRRALELSGVAVRAYLVGVYAYAGLLAAVASFIMTARMNAAHPTIAIGLEFDAIAAVVLGGTSFEKGHGGIWGTVVGALAVAVLRNGLNLIGLSTEWQVAVVGVVIVSAVALDALRRRT